MLARPLAPRAARAVRDLGGAARTPGMRTDVPGSELQLLVVAVDRDGCAGVDLASGALVRAWCAGPVDRRLRVYDVVSVTVAPARPDLIPDPSEPEAVLVDDSPRLVGRLTGRRAEGYLRAILHPPGQPLLGTNATAVPFWARTGAGPSIAVVEPEGRAVMTRQDGWVECRFVWCNRQVQLPVVDRRVAALLAGSGQAAAGTTRGDRLVVALTPPIGGHCHKVVAGLLPRL